MRNSVASNKFFKNVYYKKEVNETKVEERAFSRYDFNSVTI